MASERQALCYALTAVLLWSTVASAFKISLQYLSPIQLLFWASLASVCILGLVLTLQGKLKELLWMPPAPLLRLGLPGLLTPWLYYLVLFKAYDLLPAQEAQPLNYSWAITLSLLAVPVLGHKLRKKQLTAIGLSYFGVLVIATHGDPLSLEFSNGFGVFLALASTLIWASYWLWQTWSKVDPVMALFCNFIFALPFITLTLWLTEGFSLPDQKGLAGALYVGMFEMGLTFVLWLKALQLTRNTVRIANLIYLSPFLSLVMIHFLVGEEILSSSYIGLLLIVAGVLLQQQGSIIRNGNEEETP
ncbi:MAG TPA: DMT family transporter [Thiolapillus brandeum]|uniref:DMT family transporter n=1 Tax=Thiolapillus brandeum TaxID=1076588 RepID=A0A831JR23_9GAMM|nr:DMT family transporter [Thiolapillus brandeum]